MYFDYVGMLDDKIYGILNINCDDKGFNKDDKNIKIIKFYGTVDKISLRTEVSDYVTITRLIEHKEKLGYSGLTNNLVNDYPILTANAKAKLSKKYVWEKLKDL